MKKTVLVAIITFAFLLTGCEGSSTQPSGDSAADTLTPQNADKGDDFGLRFNEILHALKSKNKAELSKYISPEFGLMVIRADGALPAILIAKNDQKAYDASMEDLFTSVPDRVTLREEPLPKVDCELPDFYSKTGHFRRDTNLLAGSDIWKFGGLSAEDQHFTEKAIQSTTRTVLLAPGVTFFFGLSGENWYLVLVDMRKPCKA
ncbi:MAG: hypothetical protein IT233_00810 [Bacteroidia bacterium]|nr:hypothetical protein [Bacteroidia bacterium]